MCLGHELMELVNTEARDSKDVTTDGEPVVAVHTFSINTIDKLTLANIKTAAMLFAVTVIFFITFLPAVLIALGFIAYSMPLYYVFFVNNVANPFIYGFMNKNFRDDIKSICSRSHTMLVL